MYKCRKKQYSEDFGAALIELLIVVPFLAVLTFLSVAFISLVNSYTLASQSIRESAQLAALFTSTPVGLSYETCIINNRDGGCNSGYSRTQNFGPSVLGCSYGAVHDPWCAHQIVLDRVQRYLSIINITDDLKEVNLITDTTQDGEDIIFNVRLLVDHESFYSVFGNRSFDISSYAFVRADIIPSPSPSPSGDFEEESPEASLPQ